MNRDALTWILVILVCALIGLSFKVGQLCAPVPIIHVAPLTTEELASCMKVKPGKDSTLITETDKAYWVTRTYCGRGR
jgi:hypothetical protein